VIEQEWFMVGVVISIVITMVIEHLFHTSDSLAKEDFDLLHKYSSHKGCEYCGQPTCGCGATENPWT
jgi:hypothetical protein